MKTTIPKTPCACLHVRRTNRQVSQMYDNYLRPAGIRSTQYGMLKCVERLPNPFVSDIGWVLNMDQTTVTRNLEKLLTAGFVTASEHPDDPRKKKIALTLSGKAKLAEAHPLWEKAHDRILERMGKADFDTLIRLLGKLMQAASD